MRAHAISYASPPGRQSARREALAEGLRARVETARNPRALTPARARAYPAAMRVGLISDLHANVTALDAVLAELDRVGVDRLICLGDIVDIGPEPSEVVGRVRERCDLVIGGNHDPLDEGPSIPFLADIEQWTRDALSAEDRAWLDALEDETTIDVDGHRLLCVHGSPSARTDNVLASTEEATLRGWLGDRDFDVMVCGHTHVQLLRRLGKRSIVNVGSVGQPFESAQAVPPTVLPWAEFAIVTADRTGVTIELRRVHVDLDAVERRARQSTMPHIDTWLSQFRG